MCLPVEHKIQKRKIRDSLIKTVLHITTSGQKLHRIPLKGAICDSNVNKNYPHHKEKEYHSSILQ